MRTYGDVIDAYDKGRYLISPYRKYRATSATTATDLSYGAGVPIANYYASTPLVQTELPSKEGIYHGGIDAILHKTTFQANSGSLGQLTLCDYVSYIPFLDGDSIDEQVFETHALPRFSDGKKIQAMLISQGSGTLSGNATLTYTNQDGVSGRSAVTYVDGTSAVGTLIHPRSDYLQLQQGDSGIRSIDSFTFQSGIGGIYALVLVKPLVSIGISDILATTEIDHIAQEMNPISIHKDAYLNFVFKTLSGVTTNIQARLEFIW